MIDRVGTEDLNAVAKIERECFSDPWTAEMMEASMENGMDICLAYREEDWILGYCVFRILAGETELFRIGVREESRGRGIAKKLMDAMVDYSRERGVGVLSLEVREGNAAARKLYQSCGFKAGAVRVRYYQDPPEDAIIMWKRDI